jgi:NodT family efflux transporter outer membrane factor (OMF) lipoprotein
MALITSNRAAWRFPPLRGPGLGANRLPLLHRSGKGNGAGDLRRLGTGGCGLALAVVLGGCMVGPDFVAPTPAVADAWLEQTDKRLSSSSSEVRSWWKVFNDPALDALVERAYHDNLNLQAAGLRVLQARAQLGTALGNFYPQSQQFVGTTQFNRLSERTVQGSFSRVFEYTQNQIGVAASWELDFWGRFRRAVESANFDLLSSVADYDNTLVSLTADLANTYIAVRIAEKRLDIARRNAVIQEQSLHLAEVRFHGGTTTQRDVDQARTVLASTQATIPALEVNMQQSGNSLSVLLGLPPQAVANLLGARADIPTAPREITIGIPAELLRRRPDIREAEFQAAAQSARIGVEKADLYPAFSLTGQFGFLATDVGQFSLGDTFDWRSRFATVGPAVHWNFLNYGQITNRVRIQDARLQQLLIQYQQTVLNAQREVEDNLIAFLKSQDRARYLAESTQAAQQSTDLATLQYRQGITDFTTVLTAQQNLLNQQDNLALTLGDIARSLVGVYRALGGGWQLREGQEFVPETIKASMRKRTNWGSLLEPASMPTTPASVQRIKAPPW